MGKGSKGGNKGGKSDKGAAKEPAGGTVPKGGGSKVKVRHICITFADKNKQYVKKKEKFKKL